MRAGLAVAAAATIAAVGLATSGCQGGPQAKAGQGSVVLRFATGDPAINNNGQIQPLQDFVDDVSTLSGGRLKIVVATDVGSGTVSSASPVLQAIRHGEYDGGWEATRSFSSTGIPAFAALDAPFVVESYAAEQHMVTGALAGQMIGHLRGSGLVGLGIVAGPLRRPLALARPLLGPADWRGISFRVFDYPVQTQTVRELGGQPTFAGPAGIGAMLTSGQVGGQEFDIFQYDVDGFADAEHYVTANVSLWPKAYALVMNARRFGLLTAEERAWLKDAAGRAVHESATAPFDESPAAERLCLVGVRFATASPAQLAQLRTTVEPVYEQLRRDPTTAAELAVITNRRRADPPDPTPHRAALGQAASLDHQRREVAGLRLRRPGGGRSPTRACSSARRDRP